MHNILMQIIILLALDFQYGAEASKGKQHSRVYSDELHRGERPKYLTSGDFTLLKPMQCHPKNVSVMITF